LKNNSFKYFNVSNDMRFSLLRGVGIPLLLMFMNSSLFSQQDTLNQKRLKTVIAAEVIGYTATMTGLYTLWYKDEPSSSFHPFNDNKEWLQMDKIGHGVTSYYVGLAGYEALKWSGVSRKKSIWYGGTLGLFFLTSDEVFDGYSKAWGFSWGDVAVNTAGSGLFIAQQLAWDEQRVLFKYSFRKSKYADIRPNLLGENLLQNVIKDYNGQTYWLSANIWSFHKESNFPKWLNIALGYGADGMLYGETKPSNELAQDPYRQFYISIDLDLTKIKTNSEFLKTLFSTINFIKIPAPALEYNTKNGFKFHYLHF